MPSKRRKYNARFPAGRIKKIMQTDEQVGKVAQAVPIIISRTLELFVQSLLKSAMAVTNAKNARTLSPSHLKQCIVSETRFNFLKDLVRSLPDVNTFEEDVASVAPLATSVQSDTLSHFSGRKFSTQGRRSKPGCQSEASNQPSCNEEDEESDECDESESDKEASGQADENTSDFVIDEDYGT